MRRSVLILGGARSGKSRYAESLAADHPGERVYVATAEAGDEEMRQRIIDHRDRRGDRWRTVEEPVRLPKSWPAKPSPDGSSSSIVSPCGSAI